MTSNRPSAQHLLNGIQHLTGDPLDVLGIADENGRLQQVSASCAEAWGYSPAELAGQELASLVHPHDRQMIPSTLAAAKNSPGTTDLEVRLQLPDGSYRPGRWTVYWSAEERLFYLVFRSPIPHTVELEAAPPEEEDSGTRGTLLLENHPSFSLINLLPVAISVTAVADRKHLYVNDAFCQLLGYTRAEVVGRSSTGLKIVSPEGQQRVVQQALAQGGTLGSVEVTVRKADGSFAEVLNHVERIDIEGLPCWLSAFVDITAHKRTEQQVQQLNEALEQGVLEKTRALRQTEKQIRRFLDSTQEGIYTLDRDYYFELINPVGERILERLSGRRVKPGDNLLDTVPPGRREALKQLYAPVFQGQQLDYEVPYPTDAGRLWLSVHVDPLVDENGAVAGLVVSTRDVTARKIAEERLQLALEAGQIGTWELDLLHDTSVRNLRHDQIFGYDQPLKEWGQKTFFEHLLPDDQPLVKKAFEEAMVSNRLIFETRILWPDRSVHWISATGKVLRDHNDQPVMMFGTVMDTTERKKAEEALLRSNERYHLAAEASFDVIYDLDLDRQTVDVTDAISGLLGYPGGANFDVSEMRKCIHPEDKERYLSNLQRFLQSQDRYFVHEHRLLRTDGAVVYITMKALVKRRPDGTPYRVVGVLRDMTEHKLAEQALRESEAQYRSLFDATPLPAWVVDNQTHEYLAVNEAATRHYGYSAREFLSMRVEDLQPPSELGRYRARIAPGNNQSFNGSQGLWKHRKKDGTVIDVEIITHEILYQQKRARLAIARDVTEKLQAENELKVINEELHILSSHLQNVREEERINIAREIHDELGQQLTGLKMEVSWLAKKLNTDEQPLKEKAREIIGLIDDIVKSVRRIASNLRPSILDDLGLVPALEWHSREVAKRSGIEVSFTTSVELDLPGQIATGLFRIYQEALTNAVRHANAHTISSSLERQDHDLVLKISDDGRGMELSNTGSHKTLGLLGIRERTYLLGGRLDLQSSPGQGTRLTVSVPYNPPL